MKDQPAPRRPAKTQRTIAGKALKLMAKRGDQLVEHLWKHEFDRIELDNLQCAIKHMPTGQICPTANSSSINIWFTASRPFPKL